MDGEPVPLRIPRMTRVVIDLRLAMRGGDPEAAGRLPAGHGPQANAVGYGCWHVARA